MDKYAVIDVETTGNNPKKDDRIIEIGIVMIENDEISREYTSLINPEMSIPSFISNLTGIHDNDLADAPMFSEKAIEIADLFQDACFIAHNVPFDLGFLNAEFELCGLKPLEQPVLDTVELSRILYPKASSHKLSHLTELLGIQHHDPHRALSDAHVTARLFLNLQEKLKLLPIETITILANLENMLKSDLHELLEERKNALLFSTKGNKSITTYRGLAFHKPADKKVENAEIELSFGEYLDQLYEIDGSMQKQMPAYEKRTGQREMSETVFDGFRSHSHAMIEAETGTGKTLAYLLPAIYDAVKTKKRVVISTYTTQLQSQLLDEEIPFIRKIVPFPFKIALLKGKQHYISLEKFENELLVNPQNNYDIALTKAIIAVWLTETETGDIDEIQLPSSGYAFYKRISADSERAIDPYSPWFIHSYYQKARKKAQQADIIITNHALLCTDIFHDYQFLPAYEKAIIDEAHHLEESVSKHCGYKLDYANIQHVLHTIGNTDEESGLGILLRKYPVEKNSLLIDNWNHIHHQAVEELNDLFGTIYHYVSEKQHDKKPLSDMGRIQYRYDDKKEDPEVWNTIKEIATRLTFYFRDLIHMLLELDGSLDKQKQFMEKDRDNLQGNISSLQSFIDQLEQLFLINNEYVKWIEFDVFGTRNAGFLYSEPLAISELLANKLFQQKKSIILTSATLSMKQSFSFIQNRLGISSDRLITKKINSPFSYQDQVQLLIPNDFPDIKRDNLNDYIYSACEAIISLAEITKGRMLVLFTSYDMLKKSYALIKETLDTNKYILIAQGISSGSRARLRKNFIRFDQAILLGTNSFWEGVDIPGDNLSSLVIVRLPFQPPNHPIYEARAEYLEKSGKNPFIELSLPNAVIRFKQGFGRLIRSANDRGIVFVCDARIIKKRYGKYFTESIPKVPTTFASTHELMEKANKWL